ncbi:PREDICTED: forkhead box protein N1 isoform X1 [Crocodylus porosus]|uniref:forkhead box protein N1 isoform X1 n=1 Tax=Crocodylus porosus TaxID=8502 RepID=UPI00093C7307|nr:PREDICTED: forkhead box protein N1 isoform X1 [Crocodylus porosus]
MVSLLQDQASIKFPSSDTLNGDQQDDLMQMQGDSSPPEQQADNPSFSCQAYDLDSRTERKGSDSSHSPSPSSPAHDPLHGRFPASQAIHAARSKFKTTHSLDKFRRYSYDENTAGTYSSFLKSTRNPFHPYKRQISEEVFQESHQALALDDHAFKNASSVETFEELPGSTGTGETEAFPTHVPNISTEQTWCNSLQYNTRGQDPGTQALQDSEVSLKGLSLEGQPGLYCYQPQVQETYCSSHPFQQYSPGSSYPVTYLSSSQYPYQRITPQGSQESHQPLYPKPIYSYSILIFMALKNSKTGSLPVSEIYNFMTEHFPYFKTAPDGWKNSVRHNLSLNKCFEKVENKSGSSSRKGCLWALNPAKIDKMQEELQKWKRKDPVAVRKSMAKPEELDTLIGEKMDKLRPSVMACNPNGVTSSSGVSRQMLVQPHSLCDPSLSSAIPQSLHAIHPPGPLCAKNPLPSLLRGHHSSCYASSQGFPPISTTLMQQSPGIPQTIFPSGDTQSELRAQPSTTQDSPLPAQTPPIHGMKMLTEQSTTRTMQDTLMQDGDLSNDIDALNPSLTDFDLQGNLWEELKDDSLAADPLVLISSSPAPSQCLPPHCQVDGGSSSSTPHASLPDLQLTTLYSAFMEADAVSTPYLSNPGSKPIALV